MAKGIESSPDELNNLLRLFASNDLQSVRRLLADFEHRMNAESPSDEEAALYLRVSSEWFKRNQFTEAQSLLVRATQRFPADFSLAFNLAACHARQSHFQQALDALNPQFEAQISSQNCSIKVSSLLAHCYGEVGQVELSRNYGNYCLQLKDAKYSVPKPQLAKKAGPIKFRPEAYNVIAFSLFGNEPKYCETAIVNAEQALKVYPGWICRFYCDETVPSLIRHRLVKLGAEVVLSTANNETEKYFWRFKVASDPAVSHFLVRDADSVVSQREADAVQEWLHSGQLFHVMRDYWSHTELILAGMWGGVAGAVASIETNIQQFLAKYPSPMSNKDQVFLAEVIWPQIRQQHLAHDRVFNLLGSQPFPSKQGAGNDVHIGQYRAGLQFGGTLNDVSRHCNWRLYQGDKLLADYVTRLSSDGSWQAHLPAEYQSRIESGEYHLVSRGTT